MKLTVNIKFMESKVTVKLNLKRHPSPHKISRDHHALYSLSEVRFPDFNIWPVINMNLVQSQYFILSSPVCY
jgi:hypothetical protein